MTEKPNTPYAAPAICQVLGDLLDSACRAVPDKKPTPKPKTEEKK